MPTVIDSLIVTLGLDASKFTDGQKKAVEDFRRTEVQATRTAKNVTASGNDFASFFTKARNEALGLFSVLAGGRGIKEFASYTMNTVAATGRLAYNLGMSTKALSAWQQVVKQHGGGTAADANSAIAGITSNVQMSRLGQFGTQAALFKQMGIRTVSKAGAMLPITDILLQLAHYFHAHSGTVTGRQQNYEFAHVLGINDAMFNVLKHGRAATRAFLASATASGAPNQKEASALQRMQTAERTLSDQLANIGTKLEVDIAPALTDFLNEVTRLAKEFPKLSEGVLGLTAVIGLLAGPRIIGALLGGLFGGGAATAAAGAVGGGSAIGGILAALAAILGTPLAIGAGAAVAFAPNTSIAPDHGPTWLPPPGSKGAAVMQQSYAYFRSKGLSRAQAMGVLANMRVESNFNPNAVGDHGTSYGLFQEHGSRLAAMREKYGLHPTAQQQLDFAWSELNTSKRHTLLKLLNDHTAGHSAKTFSSGFEIPNDTSVQRSLRAHVANLFYQDSIGSARSRPTHNGSMSVQTHIGEITVHTKATDAAGIAQSMSAAVKSHPLVDMSNRGIY